MNEPGTGVHSHTIAFTPELVADARRALWLPSLGILAVADLHIGYAWTHRSRGQLLPVSQMEDATERLLELQEDYQPQHIVLLGDIVHGTSSLPEVRNELGRLMESLTRRSRLTLLLGNHDQRLEQSLTGIPLDVEIRKSLPVGNFVLLHGDDERVLTQAASTSFHTLIMGHEHPTLALGDGVTSAARCPCFLFSERFVVLPAFSRWANGCTVGRQPFLSPLLREEKFTHAAAIFGQRLLRVPLK